MHELDRVAVPLRQRLNPNQIARELGIFKSRAYRLRKQMAIHPRPNSKTECPMPDLYTLFAKIQSLPKRRVAEVEDFVDFLTLRAARNAKAPIGIAKDSGPPTTPIGQREYHHPARTSS